MSKKRCYCLTDLRPDGTCRYGCPPDLKPSVQRAKLNKKRREHHRQAVDERNIGVNEYLTTMSRAIAKFDKVAAYNRGRTLRVVRKSHAPGAKR